MRTLARQQQLTSDDVLGQNIGDVLSKDNGEATGIAL